MTSARQSRAGVLAAGSLLVDISKVIDAYPARDHIALIDETRASTGGPGLNIAVDLRMLGAAFPIGVAGVVGQDGNGDYILAECTQVGIDISGVVRAPQVATSFTDAMVERDGGRRTFFHHIGANALFDGARAAIDNSGARLFHMGAPGIHPRMDVTELDGGNGWSKALAHARAAGMQTNLELVSVEPSRIAELARPCLPFLDTIIVNDLEAAAVTGIDVSDVAALDWPRLDAMARNLIDRGVSQLAVVHFPAGCVAAAADGGAWRQGSVMLRPDQVRNTTGAGDALAAGVLLGLHESWPAEECLRLGVAAAASCVRSPSTSRGIRSARDCLADAERVGFRPTA